MKENIVLEAIRKDNLTMSIVEKSSGYEVLRCRILPASTLVTNGELAKNLSDVYERYYRTVRKRNDS